MNSLMIMFVLVPILVMILLMANVLLAQHRPDIEKVSAFESGMMAISGQTWAPFSIRYYVVAILFLIFDLEILLLYPLSVSMYHVSMYGFVISMLFFLVLTFGFSYELSKGSLNFADTSKS